MENAYWNNQVISARDVGVDYITEKNVRIASAKKELRCPDSGCENPILRYCHGEIKSPFFAHLNNCTCDYAEFDKENTGVIRNVRNKIYEHFKEQGYDIHSEVKILPHHYTHLLINMPDDKKVAIEISTNRISAKKVELLAKEYEEKGIFVNWIVLDQIKPIVLEDSTYYLKRYMLNYESNNDLLVINNACSVIAQYKLDLNEYVYNGKSIQCVYSRETFFYSSILDKLVLKDNVLMIDGFSDKYKVWLEDRKALFHKAVFQIREDEQKKINDVTESGEATDFLEFETKKKESRGITSDILQIVDNNNRVARDENGTRWVKCEICGKVMTVNNFCSYGGVDKLNIGICYTCNS